MSKDEAKRLVAQMSNFCKVYANMEGFCVGDGSKNGGIFIRCVCKLFKDVKFVTKHRWPNMIFKIRQYTKQEATIFGNLLNFTQLVENEGTLAREVVFGSKYSGIIPFEEQMKDYDGLLMSLGSLGVLEAASSLESIASSRTPFLSPSVASNNHGIDLYRGCSDHEDDISVANMQKTSNSRDRNVSMNNSSIMKFFRQAVCDSIVICFKEGKLTTKANDFDFVEYFDEKLKNGKINGGLRYIYEKYYCFMSDVNGDKLQYMDKTAFKKGLEKCLIVCKIDNVLNTVYQTLSVDFEMIHSDDFSSQCSITVFNFDQKLVQFFSVYALNRYCYTLPYSSFSSVLRNISSVNKIWGWQRFVITIE